MIPTWILRGRPGDRWFSSSNLKMSKGIRTLGELRSFSTFQVGHLGKMACFKTGFEKTPAKSVGHLLGPTSQTSKPGGRGCLHHVPSLAIQLRPKFPCKSAAEIYFGRLAAIATRFESRLE